MLSVRFSTSLGRSLARALPFQPNGLPAAVDSKPAQPAWIGRIPAELSRATPAEAVQLEAVRSWPEFVRQLPRAAEQPLGSSGNEAAPWWWSQLEQELELRAALVVEQWEIRGPGLLAALARALGEEISLQPLRIELVLPLQGGASQYLGGDRAWFEALLHDISPQFSEALRVGWLVACQARSEPAAARRLLIEAAADVEWLSDDPLTELALQAWLEGASQLTNSAGSSSGGSSGGKEGAR